MAPPLSPSASLMGGPSAGQRLEQLRKLMTERGVAAYLVPSADAHQSEYVSSRDKRRAFLSGFTGSSGTALVSLEQALLWTDGRYFLQAEQQLDGRFWTLMKAGTAGVPTVEQWLAQHLARGSSVGIDPRLVSIEEKRRYEAALQAQQQSVAWIDDVNLVDAVWGAEQPGAPCQPLAIHHLDVAGHSVAHKVGAIREKMRACDVRFLVVAALDEIAWLLNLRGSDISFNPVFVAYCLVGVAPEHGPVLYVDPNKVSHGAIQQYLGENGISTRPYDQFFADLRSQVSPQLDYMGKAWLDSYKTNVAVYNAVMSANPQTPDKQLIVDSRSPISLAKSLKNDKELAGLYEASVRDSAALVNFFSWLQAELLAPTTQAVLTECYVADKLEQFRSQQPRFVGPSFETISSTGANGAIIHYKPEPETCAKVVPTAMYLCDSGGQYLDGTTDVTRTWHFGQPTDFEKFAFTKVAQGHIDLATAIFPSGTPGSVLDVVARMPLWKAGLDYRHGTGHGVGAYLNVHEGPQGISQRHPPEEVALHPGMTVTNEPGYYDFQAGFGIRIENVMVVDFASTPHQFGDRDYYRLRNLTFVPIQRSMLLVSELTQEQRNYINNYHRECFEKVSPLVQGAALAWLKDATQPL